MAAAKQRLLVLIPLVGAVLALGFAWFGDPQLAPSADVFEGAPTTVAGAMALGPGLAAGSVAAAPRAAVGASARGRAVGVGGEPVAGACVAAAGCAVTTDAAGSFVLTGLPAGSVQLTASAPGLVALPIQPLWLAPDDALEDLEIVLGEACFVAGRLVDPLGTGLAGIEVQATLREIDAADGSPRGVSAGAPQMSFSAADGSFALGPFPRGLVELRAGGGEWLPFARRSRTDAADLTIALREANLLSGEVVAAGTGQPVPIEDVVLRTMGSAGRPGHVVGRFVPAPADAALGRFRIPVATTQEFVVLVVTCADGPASSEPLRALPGERFPHLRLATTAPLALRLQLRDDTGEPVRGARVVIQDPAVHGEVAARISDAEGWLSIASLRVGRYELRVAADGCRPAVRTVELPGADPLAPWVLERGGELAGTVVAAAGEVLVRDRVVIWSAEGGQVAATAAITAGRFRCGYLPAGDYLVGFAASAGVVAPGAAPVRIARGAAAHVQLDPLAGGLAALRGRLRCCGGDPGAVRVELRAGTAVLATASPDAQGAYAFGAVPPGSIDIVVGIAEGGPQLHRQSVLLSAGDCLRRDAEVVLGGLQVSGPEPSELELRDATGVVLATSHRGRGRPGGWPCVPAGEWQLAVRWAPHADWRITAVSVPMGRMAHVALSVP